MVRLDSGAHSIHLYSSDLHRFKQECFLFFQEEGHNKVMYTSPDRGVKIVFNDTDSLNTTEWFWQVLLKNFAAFNSEAGKRLIFVEEDDSRIVVNCSDDFKAKFRGKPCGCAFDELLHLDKKINQLWWVNTLDGEPTHENFWLKRKELLASFNNRNFWLYKFSKSQRVNGLSVTDMPKQKPPISSIGWLLYDGVIPLKSLDY